MVSLKITDSIVYVTFKVGNEVFEFKQAYDFRRATYGVEKYRLLMHTLYNMFKLNIKIDHEGKIILEGDIPDRVAETLVNILKINIKHPNFGTSLINEICNVKTMDELVRKVEEKAEKYIKKVKREEERRKLIEELYGKFEEHKGYYLLKYRDRKAVIVEIPREFLGLYDTEYQTLIVCKGKLYVFGRTMHLDEAKYFASKQIVKKRIVRDVIYDVRYDSRLTRQFINETINIINSIEDENLRKELLNALNNRLDELVAKTI